MMDLPFSSGDIAGLAALINSLLMWPTIKSLRRLEPRVQALEAAGKGAPAKPRRRR